ncbi:MAG: UDP-glucose--hexose-1-phosphate uridylyltransferase [Candidatus Izemoplasmatales bacterium]|nr:UDP-glucose--hexose-1-phosphate uridylyltransferase [Candidatus Izemoplasmatales bacterium]
MNHEVNQLIHYGIRQGFLEEADRPYAINRMLKIVGLESFVEEDDESLDFFTIMEGLLDKAVAKGIIDPSLQSRDHLEAQLVDCMLPRPSEVNRIFREYYHKAPVYATKYFYDLSIATNYIKTRRIAKNRHFVYNGKYAPLEISINLSKPEKDPMQIATQKHQASSDYPKCQLCVENVGYYGDQVHASRSNHRIVDLTIHREKNQWALQYSPYAYFDEHCIVLHKEHKPMIVDKTTFEELVDFLNQFPHYTIGSNAGLPIVGGSILNHHHFQGGDATFPIEQARVLKSTKVDKVEIQILDWPMSAIRLIAESEFRLLDKAGQLFDAWRTYTNESLSIFARTEAGEHNTVTPIVKIVKGKYHMYLILRNNLTTPERPYGLFHPREQYFHIKKENIGLIEVMGLAILPGRLERELAQLESIMKGELSFENVPQLESHQAWFESLDWQSIPEIERKDYLDQQVGLVFEKVLEDCAVFPPSEIQEFWNFVLKNI